MQSQAGSSNSGGCLSFVNPNCQMNLDGVVLSKVTSISCWEEAVRTEDAKQEKRKSFKGSVHVSRHCTFYCIQEILKKKNAIFNAERGFYRRSLR